MSDTGPRHPERVRRRAFGALTGMAAELVYVAALAGIGLLIAMAAALVR
jgi:hypothetical protein